MSKSKITQVTVSVESSVKIADFQYVKPQVGFSATVHPDDSASDVLEGLKYKAHQELDKLEDECRGLYIAKTKGAKLSTGVLKHKADPVDITDEGLEEDIPF